MFTNYMLAVGIQAVKRLSDALCITRKQCIPGFFEKSFQLVHKLPLLKVGLRLPESLKSVKQTMLCGDFAKKETAGKSLLSSRLSLPV
jgi:hypothetical protein